MLAVLARPMLGVRDCRHRLSPGDLFDRDFIVLAGCGDQAWVDAVRARGEPNAPWPTSPDWTSGFWRQFKALTDTNMPVILTLYAVGLDDRQPD